jgi:hypothetical protein
VLKVNEVEKITRDLLLQEFEGDLPYHKEAVIESLRQLIVYLLLHNLEKLWNILYRIDVNEQKVKALFAQNDPGKIAPEMARLIYERLEQKAQTRILYRNK